ncbi:hypothetical protein RRG08_011383 [Elysia crispata]|uniref:Uncharacterized protein n=1 Tax=Elysia crispata TaxID=231223 RepID=A0AAE1DJ95_9GAST|nr:hypothetical protein RRG08_011383 [Elysia crispata]
MSKKDNGEDPSLTSSMMHRTKGPSADKQFTKMSKGLGLCIVYADNIGGIVTPTGTPPNLVLKSQADS